MSWDEFEKKLFSTVMVFPSHTILIVGVPDQAGKTGTPFVQFGFTWKQELSWPTPSHIIRNVVRACVTRLRDIGGVDSPERLVYKAWSYPDYRDEIPEEERSVGTDELDLPTLGLQREHT